MDQMIMQTVISLKGTPKETIDWKPYLTKPKNQGPSPTCYGYSIMACFEGLYYKAFPNENTDQKESFWAPATWGICLTWPCTSTCLTRIVQRRGGLS